ncbi:MAG: IMP dehydrogenase [bacterium]
MDEKIVGEGLAFDDVLLMPAKSDVLPRDVDVRTRLTGKIGLNIPILSAAMDTVTEARLAIAVAREGGIGIIHRNMSPERQADEVEKVKKSESGMITDPITLSPRDSIHKAMGIMAKFHISGVPIVEDGKLVGILTNRDLRFETNFDQEIQNVMTKDNLITAREGTSFEEAKAILHKHRIEKLPVVDEKGYLKGLITFKDIQKRIQYPNACKDELGRLRVGAAVGVSADAKDRVALLVSRGVDVIVIDTAHGHSQRVIDTLERLKGEFPSVEFIAGNIAAGEAAEDLIRAGADAIKVGMGPGSICTTRIISGMGVPQITAIYECAKVADKYDIPVIADGGIKYSGDITKALAAGASSVMIGSLFAGTDESPGEVVVHQGRTFKVYRAMGSLDVMVEGSKDRYFQEGMENSKLVPEGIVGQVPYKGSVSGLIYQLVGGVRAGMGYCGTRTIEELRRRAKFIKITNAGLRESHPHDVMITKEAPNYRLS